MKHRYFTSAKRLIWLFPVALCSLSHASASNPASGDFSQRCAALTGSQKLEFGTIKSAELGASTSPESPNVSLPAHCEIFAQFPERQGQNGQTYAIRYHLRMPENWNGKFFFQGGGGTNGEIGSALGPVGMGRGSTAPSALSQGYAVVSQDSGHDNRLNNDPSHNGTAAFGFDPQARADYGHASLAAVAMGAKYIISQFYGKAIARSYFVGCSKGGEEGMVFAQQHPDIFDGIVAGAPGFALPRAAVEQTSEVQTLAPLVTAKGETKVSFPALHNAYSASDMSLIGGAIADACDGLDGLKDGITGNFTLCTAARVKPYLAKKICTADKNESCLSADQVTAFTKLMAGARTSDGKLIYADWAWDAGIASDGWRAWKMGSADGKIPALNVVLGGASLPAVFSVPPTAVKGDPQSLLDWQMAFNLDRDSKKIYATGGGYTRSGWNDVSAHSPDLAAFKAHGGKLIVPHGVADPVFSVKDTLAWYAQVNQRNHNKANSFARIFPVAGMAHCGGGPATSQFVAFDALTKWVEKGVAPDSILATAGPDTPWPGRTRPLCAFPKRATYSGKGSIEKAENFTCR